MASSIVILIPIHLLTCSNIIVSFFLCVCCCCILGKWTYRRPQSEMIIFRNFSFGKFRITLMWNDVCPSEYCTRFYLLKRWHSFKASGPCKRYMIKWKYACEQPIHYFCSTSPNETSSAQFFICNRANWKEQTFGRMTVSRAWRRIHWTWALHFALQSVLKILSPFSLPNVTTKITFHSIEK